MHVDSEAVFLLWPLSGICGTEISRRAVWTLIIVYYQGTLCCKCSVLPLLLCVSGLAICDAWPCARRRPLCGDGGA